MCIPHAPTQTFKADKRQRRVKPKATTAFNKKLLEPDPDFKDERRHSYLAQEKDESLLGKLFSFIN